MGLPWAGGAKFESAHRLMAYVSCSFISLVTQLAKTSQHKQSIPIDIEQGTTLSWRNKAAVRSV